MSNLEHENLPIGARRNYTGDLLEVGFTLEGGFFPFAQLNAADFDQRLSEAKQAAADSRAAAGQDSPTPPSPAQQ